MPLLKVTLSIPGSQSVPNAINTAMIVRIGRKESGAYIRLVDGNSVDVTDSFESVCQEFLRAEAKQ